MKYNVGDLVRVRKDLKVGEMYGNDTFIEDMKKYSGKTMTVDEIVKECKYYLKEDIENWNWTDEMLEDVDEMKNKDTKSIIEVIGNMTLAWMKDKRGEARCHPEDEFDLFIGAKLALERLEEKCKPYAWLQCGCKYWIPALDSATLCKYETFTGSEYNKTMLKRGIVFRTREEAISTAKKMLAALKESDSNG